MAIFRFFSKMAAAAILNLWCVFWDQARRAFGGLYYCAKFGWSRCSSFDNMHVFRFREFGRKTPIHAPKIFFGFDPVNGGQCEKFPKKAHPCASPRRLSHHVWKSVDVSDLYVSSSKRGVNKNNFGYISPMCPEALRGHMCTWFGTAVGVADIITCDKFFWWSVEWCRFCMWSKIAHQANRR